jgi:hypothetical protein
MKTQLPTWTTTEAAGRLADALLELVGTKCPLCERVIVVRAAGDGDGSREESDVVRRHNENSGLHSLPG